MPIDNSVTLAEINRDAFNSMRKMYEEQEPQIKRDLEQLGGFSTRLNQRLNELQGGRVTVPSEEALKQEEEERLSAYWGLHATMVKTHELMRCMSGVMTLLDQPSRALEQQYRLNEHYPEVTKMLTEVDTIAKAWFVQLNSDRQHLESIYEKMSKQMVTTSWEMMKFSGIVANKGLPLSPFQLLYNYVGTPVVRKLDSAPSELPVNQEAASSSTASTSSTASDEVASSEDSTTIVENNSLSELPVNQEVASSSTALTSSTASDEVSSLPASSGSNESEDSTTIVENNFLSELPVEQKTAASSTVSTSSTATAPQKPQPPAVLAAGRGNKGKRGQRK